MYRYTRLAKQFLIASIAVGPVAAKAQVVVLRPTIAYEYGVPLTIQRAGGVINRYQGRGGGISSNHSTFFGTEIALPGLFESADLLASVGLDLSDGHFESDPFESPAGFNVATGTGVVVQSRFGLRATTSAIRLDILYDREIMGPLRVGAGGWGSVRLGSAYFQTENIVEPIWATYRDGSRERTVATGDQLGSSRVHGGAVLRLDAILQLGDLIRLVPMLIARADAEALMRGLGIRALSAGAGISFDFSGVQADPGLDPAMGSALPEPPSVSLHFACEGDGAGDECEATERITHHAAYRALNPIIPFDADSLEVATRYRAGIVHATTMDDRDVLRSESTAFHGMILGIVAKRLRDGHDTLYLRPEGAGADSESGRCRAEAVRRLMLEQGVSETQVRLLPSSGMQLPSPSVLMVGTSRELLSPVSGEWLERDYAPPRIALARSVRADAGLREWRLRVLQGDRELVRTGSGDASLDEALEISSVAPPAAGGATPAPIIAAIEVTDGRGRRASAADTLRLRQARQGIRRESLTFELIVPQVDAGVRNAQNRDIVATLIASLRDGASIQITSDAPDELAALTKQIASAVAMRHLTIAEITARIQPSSAPTSRSVRIEVEEGGGG